MMIDFSSRGSQVPIGEIPHRVSKTTPEKKTKQSSGRASKKGKTTKRNSGSLPLSAVAMPVSNSPDIHTSGPSTGIFEHPFTNSQQLQLRAQIFVYGALTQEAVPDETCMDSAFGASDGGRDVWEPLRRIRVEQTRGQKSVCHTSITPVQPEQLHEQCSHHRKTVSSPIVNPRILLASPLWNIPTPDHRLALSSLHRLEPPVVQGSVIHSTSYIYNSPLPPQVASPSLQTSSFDATLRVFSGIKHASPCTMGPTVKFAPEKELSGPELKFSAPSTVVHRSGIDGLTESPFLDCQKGQKKISTSEGLDQISMLSQTQAEPVFTTESTRHLSMSTPACISSRGSVSDMDISVSPEISNARLKMSVQDTLLSIEEAKKQAEEAAALVAAAITRKQSLLTQLDMQSNAREFSDIEAKIASLAMVTEAACSVAKAATTAAKIASNAAKRAKLMADEVLMSYSVTDSLVTATSPSVIVAAKQRIQDAFTASKHAENLDAIVKAAELAAEAVLQAGKIVFLGDPLSLEVSPHVSSDSVTSDNYIIHQPQEDLTKKGLLVAISAKCGLACPPKGVLIESIGDKSGSLDRHEKETRGKKSLIASDEAKIMGVVPESEISLRYGSNTDQESKTLVEDNIKEGSLVEVHNDWCKRGWFAANVLSLENGKAFVRYTHLQSDEGEEKLHEWVALKTEVNFAPKIRIAHPVTSTRPDGTRKRLRIAMDDFVWSTGDRVDVWVPDCFSWREGVVTENDKKDDKTVNIHFPVEGETMVVKTWNLRPTLIWKEGKWIPWISSAVKTDSSLQGDTPQGKRMKLGVPETGGTSKKNEFVEPKKSNKSRLLPLSNHEKIFRNGKHVQRKESTDVPKTVRTNLQKGGPKGFSAVPNPGKKRILTDVTKRKTKTNESNDAVKSAKELTLKKVGSRGQKTLTRNDLKENQVAPSKVPSKLQPLNNETLILGSSSLNDDSSMKNRVVSSLAPSNFLLSKAKSEKVSRRKPTPGGESSKLETKNQHDRDKAGETVSEAMEQRKSNRKIQPTSRLLEGLESSMIISKILVASRDNTRPSQHKAKPKAFR